MSLSFASFIIAFGFAAAALIQASVSGLVKRPVGFRQIAVLDADFLPRFIFCMFAGPYLMVSVMLSGRIESWLSLATFVVFLALALLWSFCTGVFVVELLYGLGIL